MTTTLIKEMVKTAYKAGFLEASKRAVSYSPDTLLQEDIATCTQLDELTEAYATGTIKSKTPSKDKIRRKADEE